MSVWVIEIPVKIKEDTVTRVATPSDVIGGIDGTGFKLTNEFYPDSAGVITIDRILQLIGGYVQLANPTGGYAEFVLKVTYLPDNSKYWQRKIRLYDTTWALV